MFSMPFIKTVIINNFFKGIGVTLFFFHSFNLMTKELSERSKTLFIMENILKCFSRIFYLQVEQTIPKSLVFNGFSSYID